MSTAGRRCDNCPSASSAKEPICDSRNVTGLAEEGHARHVVVVVIVRKKDFFFVMLSNYGGRGVEADGRDVGEY